MFSLKYRGRSFSRVQQIALVLTQAFTVQQVHRSNGSESPRCILCVQNTSACENAVLSARSLEPTRAGSVVVSVPCFVSEQA